MAKYTAGEINKWEVFSSPRWIPARPIQSSGFFKRCKEAYGVLIGKYDALDWEEKEKN